MNADRDRSEQPARRIITHELDFVDLAHWVDDDDWQMSPDSFGTEDMPKETN